MAIEHDDDEERLVRIEQMLDRLRKQHTDLRQLVEESRGARESRAAPRPPPANRPKKTKPV